MGRAPSTSLRPVPLPRWGRRLGLAVMALGLAGPAFAQVTPLMSEPLGLDPNYTATMLTVDLPPNAKQPATTGGTLGHRHPGSTYAYVVKGEVVNRLGDQAERRYKAGEGWSETPNQAHYIVNASATEPARLVVVMVTPKTATSLTEPLK
jgi:quercetin dioxygenase-like cupin family protein